MANSADPDQLASLELIWIYTVCKGRVYPGSGGQGLINTALILKFEHIQLTTWCRLNDIMVSCEDPA